MGKVLYSATMSLDGFIAGPGGDVSWLTDRLGPNPTVDDLIGRVGALLVGNRTFRGSDPYQGVEAREGKPFGGGWSGPQFVLTHQPPDAPAPGVTFVSDLDTGVAAAKAAAGCPARTPQPDAGAASDEPVAARCPLSPGWSACPVRVAAHAARRQASASAA
jgi:hypothetical protein